MLFHLFIYSTFPLAVPMEWNLFFMFATPFVFGGFMAGDGYGLGDVSSPWIIVAALVACLMVFAGLISPRLPFNRHTGLRLPWTVADEGAWRAAHETLGVSSLPAALL